MYVDNAPPTSSVTPIPQAVTDSRNARMIPMANSLRAAMQWPCFAPSPAFNPNGYGPAVVADSSLMQQMAASTAATSVDASAGTVQATDTSDSPAPTVVPLNPYDFSNSLPTQTPKTVKSCPPSMPRGTAPGWGSAAAVAPSGGIGLNTLLLVGLAAIGVYGWAQYGK